jgi:hypothetical protein
VVSETYKAKEFKSRPAGPPFKLQSQSQCGVPRMYTLNIGQWLGVCSAGSPTVTNVNLLAFIHSDLLLGAFYLKAAAAVLFLALRVRAAMRVRPAVDVGQHFGIIWMIVLIESFTCC